MEANKSLDRLEKDKEVLVKKKLELLDSSTKKSSNKSLNSSVRSKISLANGMRPFSLASGMRPWKCQEFNQVRDY
jgi:hypothetical protein